MMSRQIFYKLFIGQVISTDPLSRLCSWKKTLDFFKTCILPSFF
jgi:hypothetical protein